MENVMRTKKLYNRIVIIKKKRIDFLDITAAKIHQKNIKNVLEQK